jgi:hypothetical protein
VIDTLQIRQIERGSGPISGSGPPSMG